MGPLADSGVIDNSNFPILPLQHVHNSIGFFTQQMYHIKATSHIAISNTCGLKISLFCFKSNAHTIPHINSYFKLITKMNKIYHYLNIKDVFYYDL